VNNQIQPPLFLFLCQERCYCRRNVIGKVATEDGVVVSVGKDYILLELGIDFQAVLT